MAMELHDFSHDIQQFIKTVDKLRRFFYVAHLHFNNYSCTAGLEPFPASAYEVLFVSKRIGVPDPNGSATLPNPADAPNNPTVPDCQSISFRRR